MCVCVCVHMLACVCWLLTNVSCAVRTLWYSWCRWGFCPSWWTSSSTSPWLVCCRAERWEWGLWYAWFVLPRAVDIVHMTLAGGQVGGGLWCCHGVSYHCGGHCCPQHLGWSFGKKRGGGGVVTGFLTTVVDIVSTPPPWLAGLFVRWRNEDGGCGMHELFRL